MRFQLCLKPRYSISAEVEEPERVVTWAVDEGTSFDIIHSTTGYSTPLLEPNAPFDLTAILAEFNAETSNQSPQIFDVVVTTLRNIKASET